MLALIFFSPVNEFRHFSYSEKAGMSGVVSHAVTVFILARARLRPPPRKLMRAARNDVSV